MAEQQVYQNSVDVKLDYIQRDIREIKSDITVVKNDFVNRREFTEGLNEVRSEIEPLKKILYGSIALGGTIILGAIFKLVLE